MKNKIYFDMDGTLAVFNKDASLEDLHRNGYFKDLKPMENMVSAVKAMIKQGYNVYILSSVLNNDYSIPDKTSWLKEYLPELSEEKIIFVPYGASKSEYLAEKSSSDILVDDFSKNLHEWHGVGIKVLNGINWNNKTWHGYLVDAFSSIDAIVTTIAGISMFLKPSK